MFLLGIGKRADAEPPLRRAVATDERNADSAVDADRESLAQALEALGKHDEDFFELYRKSARGQRGRRRAILCETRGDGSRSRRALLPDAPSPPKKRHPGKDSPQRCRAASRSTRSRCAQPATIAEAEPLLRRALSIQQAAPKPEPQLTIGILNTLGNLLEGAKRLDEAEKLERAALALSEDKLGPESTQLAMTCTNLADVLWSKKNSP